MVPKAASTAFWSACESFEKTGSRIPGDMLGSSSRARSTPLGRALPTRLKTANRGHGVRKGISYLKAFNIGKDDRANMRDAMEKKKAVKTREDGAPDPFNQSLVPCRTGRARANPIPGNQKRRAVCNATRAALFDDELYKWSWHMPWSCSIDRLRMFARADGCAQVSSTSYSNGQAICGPAVDSGEPRRFRDWCVGRGRVAIGTGSNDEGRWLRFKTGRVSRSWSREHLRTAHASRSVSV